MFLPSAVLTPFVTPGETSLADLENFWIWAFQRVAACEGVRFACSARSGSLNLVHHHSRQSARIRRAGGAQWWSVLTREHGLLQLQSPPSLPCPTHPFLRPSCTEMYVGHRTLHTQEDSGHSQLRHIHNPVSGLAARI